MARKSVGAISGPVDNELETTTIEVASELDADIAMLEKDVRHAYEESIGIEEAERLAAKVLTVQLKIARELAIADLDARMKKNGLKASKASVYMKAATAGDKKPSDTLLENLVAMDSGVRSEADKFETADARKESLRIYLDIFKDAHIYFRGISKGRYE